MRPCLLSILLILLVATSVIHMAQNNFHRTRHVGARQATRPELRCVMGPLLQEFARNVSLLRSDAMLAINLHLERNPTGHDHLDIEFSESFFQFALKYASGNLLANNYHAPLPIGFVLPGNPVGTPYILPVGAALQAHQNTRRSVTRHYLLETFQNFHHPFSCDNNGFQNGQPIQPGLRMVPLFNCPGYEWEQVIAIEAKRLRTDFENALARRFIANLGKLAEEVFNFHCFLHGYQPTAVIKATAKTAIYNYLTPPFGAPLALPVAVPQAVTNNIVAFLLHHRQFLVAMPFNNIQRGPHFEMNLIRAMSRMGNNILAYTRDFIRPDMALLGSEAYFPLAPLPTNATTAQAVFCGIDYRVLCQYFMPRLRDLLGPLAVPLPQPPGGVNFPPSLVAAAAHFQHIIVPALGIISPPNGVGRYNGHGGTRAEHRGIIGLFFRVESVRWSRHLRNDVDSSYYLQTDGRSFSWTLNTRQAFVQNNLAANANRVPHKSWTDDANSLPQNYNYNQFMINGRGMVRVDHHINNMGIVNQIQAGILDPHNVISVDPGIRNVVTCVNSDIQLQINNAAVAPVPVPPPAHPPSRQIIHDHVVQVSHGHMRQINGSKLSEKREEVFRDNDHRINFAYDVLAQNSPRVIGQRTLGHWCQWTWMVKHFQSEFLLQEYSRPQHLKWKQSSRMKHQRAEQALINRMAGRMTDTDWNSMQGRIVPGARKLRRRTRRLNNIPAFPVAPVYFAYGDGSWNHQRPWAILIIFYSTYIQENIICTRYTHGTLIKSMCTLRIDMHSG
ncbi:hypothetical protein BCR33DRAFT_848342 [Rhizoclosmatium globosum]|uniref:Uncharacterized protein n=1 Tax=Rhizoclosmatium globosum TaxID=329046 RepID=A0A1Y2CMR8_9FUNG|nr:hypothetical protein BCR33DRAFT_848342 [Rhizoclosmatium globosum]|eukprot:ORY48338.1 hypothetical protein BCR33DRAFT_848342 [Rhizoclosmatium globosum]